MNTRRSSRSTNSSVSTSHERGNSNTNANPPIQLTQAPQHEVPLLSAKAYCLTEFLIFVYFAAHLIIQNLAIYRAAVHNINLYALTYALIIMSRRVVLAVVQSSAKERRKHQENIAMAVGAILGGINLMKLLAMLPWSRKGYALYSLVGLVFALGTPWSKQGSARPAQVARPSATQGSSSSNASRRGNSNADEDLRSTKNPRIDLNHAENELTQGLTQVVSEALLYVYLTGVLPLKATMHDHFYYDPFHYGIVFPMCEMTSGSLLLLLQYLSFHYAHFCQCTNVGGCWELQSKPQRGAVRWVATEQYTQGAVITHQGQQYIALCRNNHAMPGNGIQNIFYSFCHPDGIGYDWIIFAQAVVVVTQFMFFATSRNWMAYMLSLLCNYGVLYICIHVRRAAMTYRSSVVS
ncbi:hypothetical protein CYMTET_25626 [Cymbomonas tetramitiformis]|uniref:Uncharacterized protein n=1 Tax=Cymbomonas tetramitiformis TaxID=36881 RepID=A0AAE0FTE2_9CHLO|nr:hypothetical protein CYMTET_25626 [Cymbomonas tetramitiformis]